MVCAQLRLLNDAAVATELLAISIMAASLPRRDQDSACWRKEPRMRH